MIHRSHLESKRGAPPVLVFLILILSVLAPQLALACFCGTTTLATQFARSDNVFTAIVIDEYLFFVPDSGEIGLCDGIRASDRAGPQRSALRAFTYGRNPDLSEPWYVSAPEDGCGLGTMFQIGDEPYRLGNLHFWRRGSGADEQAPTELRIAREAVLRSGESWPFDMSPAVSGE